MHLGNDFVDIVQRPLLDPRLDLLVDGELEHLGDQGGGSDDASSELDVVPAAKTMVQHVDRRDQLLFTYMINWKGWMLGIPFSGAPTMMSFPSGRSKERYPAKGISESLVCDIERK